MAKIAIADLQPAGSELFADKESFLHDLTNDELDIMGGCKLILLWTSFCIDCSNHKPKAMITETIAQV
jgi:hypothetical protein